MTQKEDLRRPHNYEKNRGITAEGTFATCTTGL